jgi:hypothetical protein
MDAGTTAGATTMATSMRRPITMLGMALMAVVLGMTALMPAAMAQEAQSETGVEFLDEGWWLRFREPLAPVPPAGSVGLPDDVTEIPRATIRDQTNPYRGEYTRVSGIPGAEDDEAVAAFGFDLFTLGGGVSPAVITGGTVTFVAAPRESAPQAGDGANGQRNEEGADMIACLVTEFFAPDFAGNWQARPPVDCEVSAPLEPIEAVNGRPAWELDLSAFAAAWTEENFGFSVIPNPEAGPDGQTFHVAFPNKLNNAIDTEATPPPRADITFTVEELDLPGFGDDAGGDLPGFGDTPAAAGGSSDVPAFDSGAGGGGGFDSGSTGGGFSSGGGSSDGGFGGTADAPLTADGSIASSDAGDDAAAPETADEEALFDDEEAAAGGAVDQSPLAAPAEETGGTNLGYILVPLLGLGLAGTLGYSLSKDPELPVEREGAVSKLMQRRQTPGAPSAPGAEV